MRALHISAIAAASLTVAISASANPDGRRLLTMEDAILNRELVPKNYTEDCTAIFWRLKT